MSKVRAAIIGSGLIAGKKHIPAFLKTRRTAGLVAICDLNLKQAQEVAQRFGIARAYGDMAEMIAAEHPQLIDICTPPQTHARLAIDAMRHGCHVLVEKPMALKLSDCDQMVEASRQYGVSMCVVHSDLFYLPFMRARDMVGRGEVGKFRGMRIILSTPRDYMTSRSDHWAHKLPGGVIGETGPHIVYMTLAFLKNIRSVSAEGAKLLPEYPWSRFEDYRINLVGDEGISSVTLSYATDQWMARVELLGEDGFIIADLQSMNVVRYRREELKALPVGLSLLRDAAQLTGAFVGNSVRYLTGGMRSTHEIIISRFVDSILRGAPSPVTAEEGREAVRVLQMIVEALEQQPVAVAVH